MREKNNVSKTSSVRLIDEVKGCPLRSRGEAPAGPGAHALSRARAAPTRLLLVQFLTPISLRLPF